MHPGYPSLKLPAAPPSRNGGFSPSGVFSSLIIFFYTLVDKRVFCGKMRIVTPQAITLLRVQSVVVALGRAVLSLSPRGAAVAQPLFP
jgi:hypothetical protein